MTQLTLSINGMSCGHCVKHVSDALKGLPGVTTETVTVGEAKLSYDASATSPAVIQRAISDAGYEATPKSASPAELPHSRGGTSCGCGGCH